MCLAPNQANGVKWYIHVIRRDDSNILKKAMMPEINGDRKRGRPKMTWRRQVEECGENRVEGRGSCRSNEMKGRCESDCGRDEVYPATFGDEERTGLKLDTMMMTQLQFFRPQRFTVMHYFFPFVYSSEIVYFVILT